MALGRSNKIEIDVLAESAAKLVQFNKDFGANVDRLADIIAGGGGGAGTGLVGAGQISPSASTASGTDKLFSQAPPWASARGTLLNSGASTPPNDISQGGGENFEKEYIEATKRIGAVPTDLRQFLGYLGEGQLSLPPNPFSPATWTARNPGAEDEMAQNPDGSYKMGRMQVFGRRANEAMFQYQAAKALTMKAMGKYSGFWGGTTALVNAGTATNSMESRTGSNLGGFLPFNLPFGLGSGAMMHGLSEGLWKPLLSSDFGFDGSYSFSQAQAARQAINSYGWSGGNMGDWLAGVLKNNTTRTGLDPQTQMAVLDPMLRWGGGTFQEANTALGQLASAATAAGYNVQQFTQQMLQASEQVAQQTGIPIQTVMRGMSALSATTGLNPTQLAPLYTEQNMLMAAGITHKSLGQVEFGNDQAGLLARPEFMFQASLTAAAKARGMSGFNQWHQWFYHGTPAQKKAAQDAMAYGPMLLYQTDPSAFGNISPMQLAHMFAMGGGTMKGLNRQVNIQSTLGHLSAENTNALDQKIEHMLSTYYPGNPSRNHRLVEQYIKQARGDASTRRELALRLIRGYRPRDQRTQAKYEIGLTNDAKKLVTLMGNDAAHSNSGGITGRLSSLGGDLLSGNVGGVAGDLGGDAVDAGKAIWDAL